MGDKSPSVRDKPFEGGVPRSVPAIEVRPLLLCRARHMSSIPSQGYFLVIIMTQEFAWYEHIVVFFALSFGFIAFGIYIGH